MSKNLENAPTWFVFTLFGVFLVGLVGWVLNIIEIFQLTLQSPIGWIIGRVVGVFIPIVGAILGYF